MPSRLRWVANVSKRYPSSISLEEVVLRTSIVVRGLDEFVKKQLATALEPYRETRAILPFDERAAEKYADVLAAREQAGLPIHTSVTQIAAICRAHAATCATRNSQDFTDTGINLVDPWAA